MATAKCSDEAFLELFQTLGPAETARRLKITERAVFNRRNRLEEKYRAPIKGPREPSQPRGKVQHPHRIELDIEDGTVFVGGDPHYWPDRISTAHRAFVKLIKEFKPRAVIMNGDVFDGASISRHPPIGWEKRPSVIQEIEACQERLGEIEAAAGKARKIWALGNHDSRFETRLATVAPEYARVHGVHLRDHFPLWEPCWSCWINGNVVVKHRYRSGVHATHNNTVNAGLTIVTNHLHGLRVTPFTDYTGTRWGVDTGTLSEGPQAPQFVDYLEDNPVSWRPGFAVLTFHKGRLLWPEVVHVIEEGMVEFRGKVIPA